MNVDPNEAWPELDRLIIENLDEDRRTISDLRSLKSDLYAFANRLHEAGELERELIELEEFGWVELVSSKMVEWKINCEPHNDINRSILASGPSPLAAVRALRKKLEEEGIC